MLELVEQAAEDGREVFAPSQTLGSEWAQILTLPASIAKLKRVRRLDLPGSRLVRVPPEIGDMAELREFDAYMSYSLHWLPYEITRCPKLKESTVSTRALYGNFKHRPHFHVCRGWTIRSLLLCAVYAVSLSMVPYRSSGGSHSESPPMCCHYSCMPAPTIACEGCPDQPATMFSRHIKGGRGCSSRSEPVYRRCAGPVTCCTRNRPSPQAYLCFLSRRRSRSRLRFPLFPLLNSLQHKDRPIVCKDRDSCERAARL
jgi:hypothetical protein